ncbi:DNA-methyltransferase Dcm [Bernardetia litoralis DSM 6794]|uniref:Cytosine-specific methyltransferase n=1 Tax=Bernardetia litoralis (strain ATCC 23117 / DSM 6794 / NBRC 15988 / NCIMB 1366 / Fx l1 / Sio-4) TaxID=880071 RepID=I4AKV3_BERLS|nr:DNA (cytosine-5-)-methyltransferase [Bernardetia litoralis]AFM04588.1 DNA-methyltransferase Dcm [Bernardetia litoralis DSM 6794]
MKKNLVSLFSGCGGMDIGFEGGFKIPKETINIKINKEWIEKEDDFYYYLKETIFETKFANDINQYAKKAWNDYFFNTKNRKTENDIFRVGSIVDIVKEYQNGNTNVFPKDVEIVTGGFPCQDFSVSGKRKGFDSHKDHNGKLIKNEEVKDTIPSEETRGKLYMWMKEVIEITKPKIFIAENVKGLTNLGEVEKIIQADFSDIDSNENKKEGYLVLTKVLHSGMYGVPQSRERIFFIGFKKSALTKEALEELNKIIVSEKYTPYPIPTHKLNGEIHTSSLKDLMINFTKSAAVLMDLEEPEKSTDFSQRYYSKAKFMGAHCQGQKEVNLEKLAPTIRAEHHGNIEYRRLSKENGGKINEELEKGYKERRLTLRECARIQTFPDDYNFVIPKKGLKNRFEVSASVGYKLVGNAVPPLLAYHLAKKIESNWELYFGEEEIKKIF